MFVSVGQALVAAITFLSLPCSTLALPAIEAVKRGGPEIPCCKPDYITDMKNITKEFPLGRAPLDQLPCRVDVTLGPSWSEQWHLYRRHRLMFKVPRSDIPFRKVLPAASAAWYLNIYRSDYDSYGRCNSDTINMQIWMDKDQVTWFMDWTEWAGKNYEELALCAAQHFRRQWGQWTGCEWDFGWEDFQFNGTRFDN